MKSFMTNTRIAVIALAAIFTIASATPAFANEKEKDMIPVELKCVGYAGHQPVFDLIFNNDEESEFTVIIRDEHGTIWHKSKVKGTKFKKRFSLNIEVAGNVSLQFEIRGKKTDQPVIFEVENNFTMVENLAINKLK